ncbi:MAG: lipoprotein [Rhizobiaceae bacterium]
MSTALKKTAMIFVTLLVTASALSGCGRRGALEQPASMATIVETDEYGEPVEKKKKVVEDKPFILDALL